MIRAVIKNNNEEESTPKKYKILVVDDEEINVMVLRNYLERENYEVYAEYFGKKGLEFIKKTRNFDLILLDVMLPDISGFDICRELRKEYSKVELPILFLTAKTDTKSIVEGFSAGGNDYITKPFEKLELFSRIRTLLDLKQSIEWAIASNIKFAIEEHKRIIAEEEKKFNIALYENFNIEEIFEKIDIKISEKACIENLYIYLKEKSLYVMNYSKNGKKTINRKLFEKIIEDIEREKHIIFYSEKDFIDNNSVSGVQIIIFPMLSFDNIFGFIIIKYKYESKERIFDKTHNYINQGINAIENVLLLKEIEIKNEELYIKTLLLEKNIKKLKAMEKFLSVLYSYNNIEIALKCLTYIILSEISVHIEKVAIFKKSSDAKNAELSILFSSDKISFLKKIFSENYLKSVEEFVKEFDWYTDKTMKNLRISRYNEINTMIKKLQNKFICMKDNASNMTRLLLELNCYGGYVFSIQYMDNSYGFIFIAMEKKLINEELNLINHLIEVLSLFLEKKRLEKSRIDKIEFIPFRCSECNRMLLTYKGNIEFVETKCPKCSTMNKLSLL